MIAAKAAALTLRPGRLLVRLALDVLVDFGVAL